jgi:hypothetical protein
VSAPGPSRSSDAPDAVRSVTSVVVGAAAHVVVVAVQPACHHHCRNCPSCSNCCHHCLQVREAAALAPLSSSASPYWMPPALLKVELARALPAVPPPPSSFQPLRKPSCLYRLPSSVRRRSSGSRLRRARRARPCCRRRPGWRRRRRSVQLHAAHSCFQARHRRHHQVDSVDQRRHLRVRRRRSVPVGHEACRRVPASRRRGRCCRRVRRCGRRGLTKPDARRVRRCRVRGTHRRLVRCRRRGSGCRCRVRRSGSRLLRSWRGRRGSHCRPLGARDYSWWRRWRPRHCDLFRPLPKLQNCASIFVNKSPLYDHHATCLLVSPARRGWSTRCRLRQSPSGRQWTTQSTAPV